MLRKKLLNAKGAILSFILLLGIISVIFLWNYESEPEEKQQICQPLFLEYTLGDIDSRFNLKNEEIIEVLKDSEIWEEPLEYDILHYNPEAYFKINFVFDERQEYDMLERKYSELQDTLNFTEKTKKETAKIQKEMAAIEAKEDLLSDKIYSSGEKYGEDTEAYTQGDYTGNSINIYNFDDREELVTLLAHEFGHALEVPDNQDPDSIMSGINSGHIRRVTPDDLEEAKNFCVNSQ